MASITIRKLDDATRARLRRRAARHGRSMEDEAREILTIALNQVPAQRPNSADSIRRLIEPVGGIDLKLPRRRPVRNDFDVNR